ncbi:MAG: hypothetical protein KDI36_04725 [Pseudomonadales bacterium]|nr:hypothetical protein [Pseudomonadales bacterium]
MKNICILVVITVLVSLNGCKSSSVQRQDDTAVNNLGVTFNGPGSADFSLWAPTAQAVRLQLFGSASAVAPIARIPLIRDGSGTWRTRVSAADSGLSDLAGLSYQYLVDGRPVLDPYAKSMAVTRGGVTGRAGIVDLNRFSISGFANIAGYNKREDAIIYEMHVRDFTVDPDIENTLNGHRFGTYLSFIQRLGYLRNLGVTHIQLLPVMAFYYGDEQSASRREWAWKSGASNYNWGYDPHSYFAPTGMYASDPADPQARVDELKQLIEAIHDHGMGVILDVVYNHHPVASILDDIEPGYYYRDRNDSFAGIDLATERPLVRKLITDSVTYWTREYKVDGFRFDLMGLIDQATMAEAYKAVSRINQATLFLGEGWRMYQGPTQKMADQDWVTEQNFAAVFSDEIRDLIKSGYSDEGAPRFITGGAQNIRHLFNNLMGRPSVNLVADDPGDLVQYVAAHDNLTLHDVIAVATGLNPYAPKQEEEILKRQKLANLLVLTSQGIAFLHGGQEYGRTKRWRGDEIPTDSHTTTTGITYIHNSYDSPDIVNFFDWSRVDDPGPARDAMLYTRGLILLRRSTDAFRLGTAEKVARQTSLIESPDVHEYDHVIAYTAKSEHGDAYHVFVNADSQPRLLRTAQDFSHAEILVDGIDAGTEKLDQPTGVEVTAEYIRLQPLTGAILRTR